MKIIGGSIIILASSILISTAILCHTIMAPGGNPASDIGMIAGMVVGLLGLGVLVAGFLENRSIK
jgi:hypothetical protein